MVNSALIVLKTGLLIGVLSVMGILAIGLARPDGKLTPAQQTAVGVMGAFTGLMAVLFFALVIYRLTATSGAQETDGRGRTSKTIAYFVMAAFILGLAAIYAAVITAPNFTDKIPESAKTWLEVFKNGYVLLGTVLTTIVGFYFGAKQTEQVQDQLKAAYTEREQLVAHLTGTKTPPTGEKPGA